MNKKEKVWKYLIKNPLASSKQIAKAVGCTTHYAASLKKKVGTPKEVFRREQDKLRNSRVALLEEAVSLTSGERNKDYGDPVENMTNIAKIFNAITGHTIKVSEVPMFHIATKLARMQASPTKRDHYVDIMAYAGIAYECEKK
jgi:hypothetical protein